MHGEISKWKHDKETHDVRIKYNDTHVTSVRVSTARGDDVYAFTYNFMFGERPRSVEIRRKVRVPS